jgi:hypothetical protein
MFALQFKTIATGVHTIGDSAANLGSNARRPSVDLQKKQQ